MDDAKAKRYVDSLIKDGSDHLALMNKYLPGWVDAAMATRRIFYPAPEDEAQSGRAIPRKYRELIMIALELGTQTGGGQSRGQFPGVVHTRTAVKEAGATPQEIAEVIAITTFLCGQPVLVDYGAACIKAAEEAYEQVKAGGTT